MKNQNNNFEDTDLRGKIKEGRVRMKQSLFLIILSSIFIVFSGCYDKATEPSDSNIPPAEKPYSPRNFGEEAEVNGDMGCLGEALKVIAKYKEEFNKLQSIILIYPEVRDGQCVIIIVVESDDIAVKVRKMFGEKLDDFKLIVITSDMLSDKFIPDCLDHTFEVLARNYDRIMSFKGVICAYPDYKSDNSNICFIRIIVLNQEYLNAIKSALGDFLEDVPLVYEIGKGGIVPRDTCYIHAEEVLSRYKSQILETPGVVDVYITSEVWAEGSSDTSKPGTSGSHCFIVIVVKSNDALASVKAKWGEMLEDVSLKYEVNCYYHAEEVLSRYRDEIMNTPGVAEVYVIARGMEKSYPRDEIDIECYIIIIVESESFLQNVKQRWGDKLEDIPIVYEVNCYYHAEKVLSKYIDDILATPGVISANVIMGGRIDTMPVPMRPVPPDPDDTVWNEQCYILILVSSKEILPDVKARWGDKLEDIPVQYQVWEGPPPPSDNCEYAIKVFGSHYDKIMRTPGVVGAYVEIIKPDDEWRMPHPEPDGKYICVIVIVVDSEENLESVKNALGESIEGVPLVYEVKEDVVHPEPKIIYFEPGNCGDTIPVESKRVQKEDSLKWSVEDGILIIIHINSYQNCCAKFKISFELKERELTVMEVDTTPVCRCMCYYNVVTKIAGLEKGKYHLIYKAGAIHGATEPYWTSILETDILIN